ncbi:hypothetical protein B0H16DRAFT_1565990 [Mycena metata]|uniref:Secreted protein n=1 Tax=Mycena metata TaxID=1033252 RepID=A0AAD7N152_9AGAR|nr:hypothetical protein B0H16DRAFT_1565990 [Mycena metata]
MITRILFQVLGAGLGRAAPVHTLGVALDAGEWEADLLRLGLGFHRRGQDDTRDGRTSRNCDRRHRAGNLGRDDTTNSHSRQDEGRETLEIRRERGYRVFDGDILLG